MILQKETFERFGYYPGDLKQHSGKKIVVTCDDCGKVRITSKNSYHALCHSCAQKGERHPFFGKHPSEETRKKNSDAHKGERHHFFGKHHSEETRKKISDSHKGENHPNYGKTGKNASGWKGGKVKCICENCGTKFPVEQCYIKRGGGKFCTKECYGKWASKHHRGKNSANWQGGISFEPYCVKFNEPFKEYIRSKFGRVCFLCGKTEEENGRKLSVHHVNYNKNCGCDGDETCQFVPLCIGCNSKVNKNREMWEKKIKAKMRNKLNGWYV